MFKVQPILGRVIVRIEQTKEVESSSGIIVKLDSKKSDKTNQGRDRAGVVVAIDKAFYSSPRNAKRIDADGVMVYPASCPDVSIGDRVFFQSSWQGEGWEYEGGKYHTLEGDDVAGLLADDCVVEAGTM